MFLTLGAISLLLGCAGLAALLQRNLYDRRKEIKYLRVIGFSKKMISNLVFKEHLLLFSGGIFTGLIAALIAIIPVFQSPQGNVPIAPIFLALLLLILTGIITLIASIKHSIIR
jgi:ABC-type antimicrobial peptide transport system permease subunit